MSPGESLTMPRTVAHAHRRANQEARHQAAARKDIQAGSGDEEVRKVQVFAATPLTRHPNRPEVCGESECPACLYAKIERHAYPLARRYNLYYALQVDS